MKKNIFKRIFILSSIVIAILIILVSPWGIAEILIYQGDKVDKSTKTAIARSYYEKALSFASFPNTNNKVTITNILNHIAETYAIERKYVEAYKYYEEAYNLNQNRLKPNLLYLRYSLQGLAYISASLGKYKQSEYYYKKLYEATIKQTYFKGFQEAGFDKILIESVFRGLGNLYLYQGKYKEAEINYNRAISCKSLRSDQIYSNLGILNIELQNYDKAKHLIMQAYPYYNKDPKTLFFQENSLYHYYISMGLLYHNQKKFKEAEIYYKKAIYCAKGLNNKKEYLSNIYFQHEHTDLEAILGLLYIDEGRFKEAEGLLKSVYQIKKDKTGLNNPDTACALYYLGYLNEKKHNKNKASAFYFKADSVFLKSDNDLKQQIKFIPNLKLFCRLNKHGVF